MGLAVLASGTGTLLEAMLEADLAPTLVLADRPCRALDVATAAGVPTCCIERRRGAGFDRTAFTDDVLAALHCAEISTVAMAGFMTILGPRLFDVLPNRVLNSHPSLLPAFPGPHAVRDALAYGVKVTGCTVHLATAQVDHGPILAQEAVRVRPSDDVASLHERIKVVERRIYPRIIRKVMR